MAKTTIKDLQKWKSSQKFSGRVTRQGKKFNAGTAALLDAANVILQNSPHYGREKEDMTIVQGSYSGSVSASAGTHNGGAAADLTPFNWINRSWVLRILGATGSRRPAIRGVWSDHIHTITCGDGTASAAAARQVTSYYNGRNGLANNGKDADKRPKTLPILFVAPWDSRGKPGTYYLTKNQTMRDQPNTGGKSRGTVKKDAVFTVAAVVNVKGTLWAINIHGNCVLKSALTTKKPSKPAPKPTPAPKPASFRIGTLNFPDGVEKIKGVPEKDRVAKAVAQIKAKDLHVVGMQELVGRDGNNDPSYLAEMMLAGLGKGWDIVVPTTNHNENYFFINSEFASLKKKFNDAIIRGGYAGKHVSLIQVDSDAVGVVNLGNTHLVPNNREGAEVQAVLAASALSSVGAGQQRILLGDFNTSGPLSGLTAGGLLNSRITAAAKTGDRYATYTKYATTKPSTNLDWQIDGLWHSSHFVCTGYTQYMSLDSKGNFTKPRVSDHVLTLAALRQK